MRFITTSSERCGKNYKIYVLIYDGVYRNGCNMTVLNTHPYLHVLKHVNGRIATSIVVVVPCCQPDVERNLTNARNSVLVHQRKF